MDLDPLDFASDLPDQFWHLYYQDDTAGLTVGVWTTTDMQETFGPYPGDEFMVLLDGDVTFLDGAGLATNVRCGDAFAVKNGVATSWVQVGFCRKFFVIHNPPDRPTPETGQVKGGINILNEAKMSLSLHDTPATPGWRETLSHSSDTSEMRAGLCELSMDCQTARGAAEHEFVTVLSGQIDVMDGQGTQLFGANDSFFLPAGTQSTWSSNIDARALFCRVKA